MSSKVVHVAHPAARGKFNEIYWFIEVFNKDYFPFNAKENVREIDSKRYCLFLFFNIEKLLLNSGNSFNNVVTERFF